MKTNLVFGLQNAAWPALLIEETGVVRRANAAARGTFGAVIQEDSSQLSAIWAAGNETTAQLFLVRPLSSPQTLKLRLKNGETENFLVHLCAGSRDGKRFFLFQFFRQPGAGAAASQPETGAVPAASTEGATLVTQRQKLDCALQLARSVSHDFNDALTSILGHTSLLLQQAEGDHPWRESLMDIEKSASKAAEITRDLATFSRHDREARAQNIGNINDVLRRVVDIFQQSDKSGISWEVSTEKNPFASTFDEAMIQQAFTRILENAVESLSTNGWIGVQARNVEVSEATQDRTVKLDAGNYLCIDIADNGSGIDADNLPRVFEPFFTTKSGHRGLGLALVYGIVTNHGGGVTISSEPGRGTSVRIYLPAMSHYAKADAAETHDLRGTGTILVVDDEDMVLKTSQAVLGAYGYTVVAFNSGQKAVDFLSQPGSKVKLVVTDLVMPQMSGRDLADRLTRLAPDVPVIFSSGYVMDETKSEGNYLQKPFTAQELLRKVRGVLSKHRAG